MKKIRDENFISLSEATKFCNYSQEYLSLRVRQGKLKGIKLGRNWVTKKEWITEYVGAVLENRNGDEIRNGSENWNENKNFISNDNQIRVRNVSENLGNKKEIFYVKENNIFQAPKKYFRNEVFSAPPANLPVGQFSDSVQELFLQKKNRTNFNSFVFLFFVFATVLFSSIYFSREKIGEISYGIFQVSGEAFNKSADKILGKNGKDFVVSTITNSSLQTSKYFEKTKGNILKSSLSESVKNILEKSGDFSRRYFSFIKNELDFFGKTVQENFVIFVDLFRKKEKNLATEELNQEKFVQSVKDGMVVIPTDETEKEILKTQIQESFSDQIMVNISDETTGVIIPVFKERKGSEFMYMLVPTNVKAK